jgi:hypothetical protein
MDAVRDAVREIGEEFLYWYQGQVSGRAVEIAESLSPLALNSIDPRRDALATA